MKKGKAITLLSLISLVLVALLLATFVRFSVGIKDFNSILGTVGLEYDLTGGTSYTYSLDRDKNTVCDIDEVIGVVNERMEKLGYSDYTVETVKKADKDVENYDLKVSVLASEESATNMNAVFSYGLVEMYLGSSANPTDRVLADEVVIADATFSGAQNANGETYYPVSMTFTDNAYAKIQETFKAGSCYMSLKLNGTELLSGSSELQQSYFSNKSLSVYPQNEAGARILALQLSTGGLEYAYKLTETETFGAVLGEHSALYAVLTVSAILVVAIVALSIMFKGFGLISGISLLAFILGEVGLLVAIPGVKVSMAGVAGIIFATMLAVDGMVLIIKRIDEEFGRDKTLKASVKTGYKRALTPILNTHVVSLIISLLVLIFVTPLKSFAITASIGIIVSFIATVLFSRLLVTIFIAIIKNKDKFLNLKRVED